MELKTKLIELFQHAFAEEQTLFAKLSEEERARGGKPDCWAPKDIFAHLAAWEERVTGNLAAAAQGGTPVNYADYESLNAQDFERYRDWSWAEIMDKTAVMHERLVEQVESRDEAELRGTETLPWQGERPLWQVIAGSGYIHRIMHLDQIYTERGEPRYATKLQERAAEMLAELSAEANWQGVVRYNLACHYALVGAAAQSIAELAKAFELNPGLKEWSKEDPDLVSIRPEPGYAALVA